MSLLEVLDVLEPNEYLETLSPNARDYIRMKSKVLNDFSFYPELEITGVSKVHNSFLKVMYDFKKTEYMSRYGTVNEHEFFHSTKSGNVLSIIQNNFDWRLVIRTMYGRGTSFSTNANYANCHANRHNEYFTALVQEMTGSMSGKDMKYLTGLVTWSCNPATWKSDFEDDVKHWRIGFGFSRAFIVCDVLVSNKTEGDKSTLIPPAGFDTTGSHNDMVYVKFQDNEFLPKFVVYYNCPDFLINQSEFYRNWR